MVVELPVAVVDAEAGANDGFAAQSLGRPGKGNARVDVQRVGIPEAGSHAAEASCAAGRKVEGVSLAVNLVKDVVKRVADTKIQSEVGSQLPLVLRIGVCLRLDRKSTRLNSSHLGISYAVFC